MKFTMGCFTAFGLVLATAAQAQVLPPMRGDAVVVSDFEEPGPYAAMRQPRIYMPGPRYSEGYAPSVLLPHEIYAIVREAGFSPLGAPQQRGLVYTMAAIDRRGEDGRMVIDARSGRILRFMPAYQMGDRMNEEIVVRYGPQAALPELPQYRRPPFDANAARTAGGAPSAVTPPSKQKVASRTATVPLPKAPPAKAVATPAKPVAVEKPPAIDKPIAEKPPEPAATPVPAPVQQSAVTETKPAEVKAPEPGSATAAPPAEKAETPPTVAPPATEAKPETPAATGDKPAVVQGLE
ncbi:hypothetical protein E0H22_05710 [Rhodopseudomonas boonkerdii]|uniref:hypothetical protein n=1 Tax=Rhodopseudomonas boonkerdii TaxID=475937 RepID=UPI001E42A32C|nr:hypothetical protein [Rhodopseudomonas boonkerdii]UGV25216.1 hypothetical protein E0H22_05710 [Rhodopseudomonas boonkerdii]